MKFSKLKKPVKLAVQPNKKSFFEKNKNNSFFNKTKSNAPNKFFSLNKKIIQRSFKINQPTHAQKIKSVLDYFGLKSPPANIPIIDYLKKNLSQEDFWFAQKNYQWKIG